MLLLLKRVKHALAAGHAAISTIALTLRVGRTPVGMRAGRFAAGTVFHATAGLAAK